MSSSAVLNMDPTVVESSGGGSSVGSSSSSQQAVVASATIYVQDLVNEMTQTVLQSSAAQGGSQGTQQIVLASDDNSNGSNSSTSVSATIVLHNPMTSTTTNSSPSPKRLAESDHQKSAKSSNKRSKSSKTLTESESLLKQKLEQRLGGILCCAVCLELPKSSVYQCANGHLMCAGCFTHLLADARIRDETATCPNCRCVISKEACSRNLAVEKAVCELPGECRFCNRELPRSMLDKHMADICEERIVSCRYAPIGCPWNGPFHETEFHAESCSHPTKCGKEVLSFLGAQEKSAKEEKKIYDSLFSLLSFEKITLNDLQFRPYRTDEYIHKLFYETARFSAFNMQWVVKARVNDDQRDPTQSCERQFSFQISLKTKLTTPMTIHYMLLKGPFGDMKVLPKLYKHDFVESSTDSAYCKVNLVSSAECNRLLAAKVINFRLIMFMATK